VSGVCEVVCVCVCVCVCHSSERIRVWECMYGRVNVCVCSMYCTNRICSEERTRCESAHDCSEFESAQSSLLTETQQRTATQKKKIQNRAQRCNRLDILKKNIRPDCVFTSGGGVVCVSVCVYVCVCVCWLVYVYV
jgi:hypothetical protein